MYCNRSADYYLRAPAANDCASVMRVEGRSTVRQEERSTPTVAGKKASHSQKGKKKKDDSFYYRSSQKWQLVWYI